MRVPARTPEECDHLFGEYFNRGDLDTVFGRLLAMRPKISLEVVKVVTAGDDLAMVYSDWSMSAHQADGQLIEVAGKAIEVVCRQPNGAWLFVLDDPFARA